MTHGKQGEDGAAAVRIEDLLAEAKWIRSLARSLVGDGQAVDDVVQETWLAVLRRPPLADRPLRPWLARVVTNFARMQRRGEGSRQRREASVARAEQLSSAAEQVERLETQRALAEVVVSLSEPLRETVLLRYFGGLSSAEIARRTGTPAGTVRWRLKRGLEELRTTLDRRHGGRRGGRDGWLPAVAALARRPAPVPLPEAGATAPAGIGGAAVLGAALALGLAACGFWLLPRWLARPAARAPALALAAAPEQRGPAPAEREAPVELVRPSAPGAALAPAAPASGTRPFVELRAVDPDGLALAGATVSGAGGASARTDASGAARLEQPPGVHELRLEAEGYVARAEFVQVGAQGGVGLGTLALERAGSLAGRVVDEQGRGLAGAALAVEEIGSRWMEAPQQPLEEARYLDGLLERGAGPLARVRADEAGRFAVDGLPPGFVRVWASAPGRVPAYSAPLGIAPGGATRVEPLALRRPAGGELIHGRVLDPSGRAVQAARVEAARRSVDPLFFQDEPYVARASTDASGRFELLVHPGARYDVAALQADGSAWAAAASVDPGSEDLLLELAPRRTLRVRWSVDETQGEDVRLLLTDARRARRLAEETVAEDAESRTLFAPLAPFLLAVERPGCEPAAFGPFDPRDVPAELALGPAPGTGLAGRVTGPAGVAVPGALVTVLEPAPDPAAGEVLTVPADVRDGAPFTAFVRPLPFVHQTRADAEGRFRLPDLPGRELVLRVEAPDAPELAPAFLGPLELSRAARGTAAPLALELDGGGTVTGRVRLAGRADPLGVVVGLSAGDGRLRSTRVGPDGSFRFEVVPAGPVQLRRLERGTRTAGWQRPAGRARPAPLPLAGGSWGGVVARGGLLDVELDLSSAAPTRVTGRLTIDGRPPGPWQVRLLALAAGERAQAASGVLAPDGSFDVPVSGGGAHVLELWNAGFEPVFCVVREELELVAGQVRDVRIDYATGELSGAVGAPECTDVHHVWRGDATLTVTTRLEGDAQGRSAVRVPAGAGALMRGEVELARVDLEPGGRVEFELAQRSAPQGQ